MVSQLTGCYKSHHEDDSRIDLNSSFYSLKMIRFTALRQYELITDGEAIMIIE